MDEPLFAELESCWATLASGIAHADRTAPLGQPEHAARRLTERLAFLAVCRGRGILPAAMPDIAAGKRQIEKRFDEWLESAEARLGSALFEVEPGHLGNESMGKGPRTPRIEADALRGALGRLGSDDLAAALAGRPVEILGRIHERLLGRRFRQAAGGRFKVTQAAEARKAAGVFYTPEYLTRYMATHSLGRQLEAEPPKPTAAFDLEVLDPACGCGAFLLAAVRVLRQWFQANRLPAEPRRLARHVHGMEIDPEAVLVARRSLWLEWIAGQAEGGYPLVAASSRTARSLLAEVARNVRCGDVLVDSAGESEAGRFDVVLGNPPYRRELDAKRLLDRIADTKLGRRYRAPRMDLWYYFVHRGLELLKPGGRLSFVVHSYWTSGSGSQKLIRALRRSAHVEEIFSLGQLRVFPGVSGRHMILRILKQSSSKPTQVKTVPAHTRQDAEPFVAGRLPVAVFEKTASQLFRSGRIDLEPPCEELLAKIGRGVPLETLGRVRQGIVENPATVTPKANRKQGNRWRAGEGVFALTPEELARLELSGEEQQLIRPYHDLCDLGRYVLAERPSRVLIYSTAETCPEIDRYPALRAHLGRFRLLMEARRETRRAVRRWWQLHWPREEGLWRAAKIISLQMAPRPAFVPPSGPIHVTFSTNVFVPRDDTREHLNYLAALLNSRLMWKWYRHHAKRRGVGLEINGHVLRQTPIRRIDFSRPADTSRHDRLVALVDRMLLLTRRLRTAEEEKPTARLRRQIAHTEREIDPLVYALYGLTDGEVCTVEAWE